MSRSSGSDWEWSWNPMIGIMFGPIPVGIIILVGLGVLGYLASEGAADRPARAPAPASVPPPQMVGNWRQPNRPDLPRGPGNPNQPAVQPQVPQRPIETKNDPVARLAENTLLPDGVLASDPIVIDDLKVARFRIAPEQV